MAPGTASLLIGTLVAGSSMPSSIETDRQRGGAGPAHPGLGGWAHVASSYIELHTASAFSFLQGASLPEALVDRAADLGYSALALLDRDGVYGAPRFHKAAIAAGIRPIIGAELTIAADDPDGSLAGKAGG